MDNKIWDRLVTSPFETVTLGENENAVFTGEFNTDVEKYGSVSFLFRLRMTPEYKKLTGANNSIIATAKIYKEGLDSEYFRSKCDMAFEEIRQKFETDSWRARHEGGFEHIENPMFPEKLLEPRQGDDGGWRLYSKKTGEVVWGEKWGFDSSEAVIDNWYKWPSSGGKKQRFINRLKNTIGINEILINQAKSQGDKDFLERLNSDNKQLKDTLQELDAPENEGKRFTIAPETFEALERALNTPLCDEKKEENAMSKAEELKIKPRIESITVHYQQDSNPDLSYLEKNPDEEYYEQDKARLENFYNGQWFMVGVYAEANVSYDIGGGSRRLEQFSSGGLWGIESDSTEEYFDSVVMEELDGLKEHLEMFNVDISNFEDIPITKREFGSVGSDPVKYSYFDIKPKKEDDSSPTPSSPAPSV